MPIIKQFDNLNLEFHWNLVLGIWNLIFIALLFALPTIDPDLGWFLRCGKETCSTNTFSVLLPNFQWFRPMIIYPSVISFVFNHFSFWGLTILNILLGLASFFFFHKILKTNLAGPEQSRRAVSVLAFIASTFLSFSTLSLGLRNQSLSILFFLLTIYLLEKKRNILLIPLFIVWANTHPGFPVGLALVALYALSKFPARLNALAFGGAFIATLINPFGLNIYSDIFSHLTTPLNTLIAEWVPPAFYHQFLIISLLCLFLVLSLLKKRLSLFYTLSLIFFAFLALTARRNLPFFYFFLPIYILKSYRVWNLEFKKFIGIWYLKIGIYLYVFFILIITFLATILILPKTIDINTNWNSYCHKGITNFPCEAVSFLKSQPAGWRGNIFNTYEWGGFLIWQLPQFKVIIDGRMPAWKMDDGQSPYSLYLSTYQTKTFWQQTLEKYKIDYILISPGTFLDLELKKNIYPWKEVFKSEFSVIYKRNSNE